ncbi:MAG TPA: DUF5683 domain-containing protein [Bacteroidota bacterium]|nr:DUF5683 domain-containing protein [Bacteroidota bacterium]
MILLFCFSVVSAQYRVDRALFTHGKAVRTSVGASRTPAERQMWRGATEIASPLDQSAVFLTTNGDDGTDTVMTDKDTLGFKAGRLKVVAEQNEKSPSLAMLMSAVLPGAGQVYVHRYITIPIIWGFGYYFAKSWVEQNNHYHEWSDSVSASVRADSLGKGNENFRNIRDLYRDDRDKFAFYIAIVYILNIVDAYVGASLYSFDVSDNLGGSAAIRFRIPIRYFR